MKDTHAENAPGRRDYQALECRHDAVARARDVAVVQCAEKVEAHQSAENPGAEVFNGHRRASEVRHRRKLAEEHEHRLRAEAATREVRAATAAKEERRQPEAGGGGEGVDTGGRDLLVVVGHRGAKIGTKRARLGIYNGVGGQVLA